MKVQRSMRLNEHVFMRINRFIIQSKLQASRFIYQISRRCWFSCGGRKLQIIQIMSLAWIYLLKFSVKLFIDSSSSWRCLHSSAKITIRVYTFGFICSIRSTDLLNQLNDDDLWRHRLYFTRTVRQKSFVPDLYLSTFLTLFHYCNQ